MYLVNELKNQINLKLIYSAKSNTDYYILNCNYIILDNYKFKTSNMILSNMIAYLNKNNINFNEVINNILYESCVICNNYLDSSRIKLSRKRIKINKICSNCINKYSINPNQFLYKKQCNNCGKIFINHFSEINKNSKFCSYQCLNNRKSDNIYHYMLKSNRENHWTKRYSKEKVNKIYKKIGEKGSKTKQNLNITAWNRGIKMGEEFSIKNSEAQKLRWKQMSESERKMKSEQSRRIARKNLKNQSSVSSIEYVIKNILDELNFNYKHSFFIKYQFDFYVRTNNYSYLIEVNGDYFHGNLNFYSYNQLTEQQKRKKQNDKDKLEFVQNKGYKVIVIWEQDIKNRPEVVKRFLKQKIK